MIREEGRYAGITRRGLGWLLVAVTIVAGTAGSIVGQRWGRAQVPTPGTQMVCPFGNQEDSCTPSYTGNGHWELVRGADQ